METKSDLFYRDALKDFRKRTLWGLYRISRLFRWVSIVLFVLTVGGAVFVVQLPLGAMDVAIFSSVLALVAGVAGGLSVAAWFVRRRGRRLEKRDDEFRSRDPEWVVGKFGRK